MAYSCRSLLLWLALIILAVNAAPTQLGDKSTAKNLSTVLESRQYDPRLAGASRLQEMVNILLGQSDDTSYWAGMPKNLMTKWSLYEGELTMAGALPPETGASLAAAAEDVSATAAEVGQTVFMGDLSWLPDPYRILKKMEKLGEVNDGPIFRILINKGAQGRPPGPLTGGEGLEFPSRFAEFVESMGEAGEQVVQAFDEGIAALATNVGENFVALVSAGMSSGLSASFMIGMTIWAAQWLTKMSKNVNKGWHESLEGFGKMLKDALGQEFHVDLDTPLPNGFPISSYISGLTDQLYHIYATVGEFERNRLIELGAPIETFETPNHSDNVQAMRAWAQTENGEEWCAETKLELVDGLRSIGVSVDLSTLKVPLSKSCPPPDAP